MSGASTDITVTPTAALPDSRQFGRKWVLFAGDASGQGLDLSNLRITFSVTHSEGQTPKTLVARITNPAPATVATIRNEFTRVVLAAGYLSNYATIFDGTIRQVRAGRENPTDTFVEIIAGDGDQGYTQGFMNQTLAAGHTPADVHSAICTVMNPHGISKGTPPPAGKPAIRPKVLFGPARDHARMLALSNSSTWSIENATLNYTADKTVPPANAILLSPSTGLIGMPRQTPDGVEATALLNPRLRAGRYIQIDMSLVLQQQANLAWGAGTDANQSFLGDRLTVLGISASGVYRILWVDHYGDTRGDPWYSDVVAFAADTNAVQTARGAVVPGLQP